MPIARSFAEWLVCPTCKQHLVYFEAEQFLLCPRDRLRFAITNNVPNLVTEDAEPVSADDVDRLVKLAKEQGLTGV
jgi:uncharacterized protein YbaR (Trm112 family)